MSKLIPLLVLLAACSSSSTEEGGAPVGRTTDVRAVAPTHREAEPSPGTPRAAEPSAPAQVAEVSARAATPTSAAPSPEASVETVGAPTSEGLRVRRAVISSGMVGREPTDSLTEVIPGVGTRLYAFLELDNPNRADTKIVSYWLRPDGSKHSPVELTVGPQRSWRTWAYTSNARTLGTWTAVFESLSGEPIARRSIDIQ